MVKYLFIQIYSWFKKVKECLDDIIVQYEDYARRKGISIASTKSKKWKQFKNKLSDSNISNNNFNPLEFQQEIFRDENSTLSKSLNVKRPKQGTSYKERLSDLRKINSRFEEDFDRKQNQRRGGSNKSKMTAFFVFIREKKDSIKNDYPQFTDNEITKFLGDVWRQLTPA